MANRIGVERRAGVGRTRTHGQPGGSAVRGRCLLRHDGIVEAAGRPVPEPQTRLGRFRRVRQLGSLGSGWQKLDRLAVTRSQKPEMATIERRQLRLVQPFHDREHGGVDEPDVRVGVPIAQLAYSGVVRGLEIRDAYAPASMSARSATSAPAWSRWWIQ